MNRKLMTFGSGENTTPNETGLDALHGEQTQQHKPPADFQPATEPVQRWRERIKARLTRLAVLFASDWTMAVLMVLMVIDLAVRHLWRAA